MTLTSAPIYLSKPTTTADNCNHREWLETNDTGSYASSTLLNCHSRKYHGLLIAALENPYGKFVLLSKIEEYLITSKKTYPLIMHQYLNFSDTQAYLNFNYFSINVCTKVQYQCDDVVLNKETLILPNKNILLIKYSVDHPNPSIQLSLRPFLAYRSINTLAKANNNINRNTNYFQQGIVLTPYIGMPSLSIYRNGFVQFVNAPDWYYQFQYLEEKARGYDDCEDLFTPGVLQIDFAQKTQIIVACSIELPIENNLESLWRTEIKRRISLHSSTITSKKTAIIQSRAAPQFLIRENQSNPSIVAGYHWFGEWGRDAMISLPGLTLFTGKEDVCLRILTYFAQYEYQGIIPNRIAPETNGKNDYDAVDVSLWFCWTVQQYYLRTKNLTAIQENIWKTIKDIIHFYCGGTLCDIKQAENGLIYAGNTLIKTTWMDAVVNNVPVTPRNGASVEVNALWYNALCFSYFLAKAFQDPIQSFLASRVALVKKNFVDIFWNPALGYLYDFVNAQESNTQLRPNQVFAVSLNDTLLPKNIAKQVMQKIQLHLLTPYGLRTLSPEDPNYHNQYTGNQAQRDTAYHNGTVWPWLLGAFTEGLLKIGTLSEKTSTRKLLESCINALLKHVKTDAGLGCVSEIFDGEAPHTPRGCIQQAWSVGELIRMIQLLT